MTKIKDDFKNVMFEGISQECPWQDDNGDCRAQPIPDTFGATYNLETCYMQGCAIFHFVLGMKEYK